MSTDTRAGGRAARPLSPHLQIYRFSWTMAMSITHRITGAALYGGTILLVIWLVAAAAGKVSYDQVAWFYGSILGRLILFGYTWALLHHMLGGIRHFAWDLGLAFDLKSRLWLSQANLVASVTLTLLAWIVGSLVG